MKRLAVIGLAVVLALSGLPAAFAQAPDTVHRDLQRLQDDIVNLEDSLAALEPPHPREAEMRARAERIRERVERLASDARAQGGAVRTVSSEEIRSLRADVTALQRDVDSAVGRRIDSGSTVALPEGTDLQVRLEESLTSATARPEDRFEATVAVPVRDQLGLVVIPAGTRVRGIVKAAESGQRPARSGRLDLTFDTIYLEERTATPLRASVVSMRESVDIKSKSTGVGVAIGGVLGSILGGTKGAIIGAVLGGAGAVVAKAGEDVTLPAGTILTVRLDRPLAVRR